MENENDILSKIPLDMPTGPYLLGYAQAVHDLNKDWDAFRRDAAKDAMSGMLADADFWEDIWTNNRYNGRCDYPSEIAKFAIACADELIKQLRED